jgi:polygalacturonase
MTDLKLFLFLFISQFFFIQIVVSQPVLAQIENCPFEIPKIEISNFPDKKYFIADFGAIANGRNKNTKAINNAILSCSNNGGGTVVIPKGVWLTGPIVLQKNVNLHLDEGALVVFSCDFNDYQLVKTFFEGWVCYLCQSPISARNIENFTITGQGIFDGSGDAWRPTKKLRMALNEWKRLTASGGVLNKYENIWLPTESSRLGYESTVQGYIRKNAEESEYLPIKDFLRPNMVSFIDCKKVLLQGVLLQNFPCWTIHLFGCEHLTIDGVKVHNPWYAQYSDTLDLESCWIGEVKNCLLDTGDDAICIKSGKDEKGRERARPTELFMFRDCKVFRSHGGFLIGSEMSRGVSKLFLTNCTFVDGDMGFRFKSNGHRGGKVHDIYVDGVQMSNILSDAIYFGI